MSKIKAGAMAIAVVLCSGLLLGGCGKSPAGEADAPAGRSQTERPESRSARKAEGQAAMLTKEEVAAILGHPVTTIEGKGTHLTYKTDVMMLETGIELDERDDAADAVQTMAGARKATGFLGGKPEDVPGLGDEAFFGAMSFLYVRKGSAVLTITPPNLQMVAGMKAHDKVMQAKLGSDDQVKAMEELVRVEKTDPMNAGLAAPDAAQGAVAAINASSKKQGTEYETQARAMALALATKALEKL